MHLYYFINDLSALVCIRLFDIFSYLFISMFNIFVFYKIKKYIFFFGGGVITISSVKYG